MAQQFSAVFSACCSLRMLLLKRRRKMGNDTFYPNSKQREPVLPCFLPQLSSPVKRNFFRLKIDIGEKKAQIKI